MSVHVDEAGQLAEKIEDKTIEQLTVSGTIDARDLHFIAIELKNLTSLDLSAASIDEYKAGTPVFYNQKIYAANALPDGCFAGMALTTLKLPNTLTAIGEASLAGVPAQSIELGNVSSIGDFAFRGAGITTLNLTNKVTKIGAGAFSDCKNLNTVTYNATPTEIPAECFAYCPALTSVAINANVEALGELAFSGSGNGMTVSFGSGSKLQSIGEQAFSKAKIGSINLDACQSLSTIGMYAFANCSNFTQFVMPTSVTSLGEGAFYYNETIADATVRGDIPDFVFAGNKSMRNIYFNGNPTTVGKYALARTGIERLTVPEGISTIDEGAFYETTALDSLSLPKSLTNVGSKAFSSTALNHFGAKAVAPASLGENVFENVNTPSRKRLFVEFDAVDSYQTADQWKDFYIEAFSKGTQTITWEQTFENVLEGDNANLSAVASSGLDITYKIEKGGSLVTLEGNKITFNAPGEVIISANQAGNNKYLAAEPVRKTITINMRKITLSDHELSMKIDDEYDLKVETSYATTVTWETSDASVVKVDNNGRLTALAEGTATITVSAYGATDQCVVTVSKHLQTINWDQVFGTVYEGDEILLSASATSGLPVTYTVTKAAGEYTLVGNQLVCVEKGQYEVTAAQPGDSKYYAAVPVVKTINVQSKVIQSIVLNEDHLNLKIDDTFTLVASVAIPGSEITWTTSDANVATVDNNGFVTAVAEGFAVITASVDGVSATCEVTVTKRDQEIVWEQSLDNLYEGDQVQLVASSTSGLAVYFEVSEGSERAYLSGNVLTITAPGEIVITALQDGDSKYNPASLTRTIVAKEKEKQTITLSDDAITLEEGDVYQLEATTKFPGTVLWVSSNEAIATVDQTGYVTAIAEGTATITAIIDGVSATCEVTVTKKPGGVESIDEGDITATFINGVVYIKSPSVISAVEVFGVNGVRLLTKDPQSLEAEVDMNGFYGSFYIIRVTTETGIKKEFKLTK